jgi:5-(carboxyamino)imidazole ribonucleotide synthase
MDVATRDHGNGPRPSGRVVMIGAGQLARMTQEAAIDYGVDLHVLATSPDEPAVTAGASFTIGHHDRLEDLLAVSSPGDIVTFDHELVPRAHLLALEEAGRLVRPRADALIFAADKLASRTALSAFADPTIAIPDYAPVMGASDVATFAAHHGWPVVLKTRRGGYDGRGVFICHGPAEVEALLGESPDGEVRWLVEEYLDLAAEFAVVVARRPSGEIAIYPPVATVQVEGICRELAMPSGLDDEVVTVACAAASSVVARIDAVGICAVEFFLVRDARVLVNELALRPHNSGHATIEACVTSQFHQHLRAVLDWPLGATDLVTPAAAMVNVIGEDDTTDPLDRLPTALAVPDVHIHLYRKTPRAGRKLGHVTVLGQRRDTALDRARAVATILTRP